MNFLLKLGTLLQSTFWQFFTLINSTCVQQSVHECSYTLHNIKSKHDLKVIIFHSHAVWKFTISFLVEVWKIYFEYRLQFHQHFTCTFFVQNFGTKNYKGAQSTFVQNFGVKNALSYKNVRLKCWWN